MSSRATVFAFVLATLFAKSLSADLCSADDTDLCTEDALCSVEEDLCPGATTIITTKAGGTVTSTVTVTSAMATRKGSMRLSTTANKAQVKQSLETSMGKLLHEQGVGGTPEEAAGYVNAVVTEARRLAEKLRELASHAAKTYNIAWTMTFPNTHSSDVDAFIANVTTNPAHIQNAMQAAFTAAGVNATVTVSHFNKDVAATTQSTESDTDDAASPFASILTIATVLLMSSFALQQ